jgi:hypothetical protein
MRGRPYPELVATPDWTTVDLLTAALALAVHPESVIAEIAEVVVPVVLSLLLREVETCERLTADDVDVVVVHVDRAELRALHHFRRLDHSRLAVEDDLLVQLAHSWGPPRSFYISIIPHYA